MTGYTALVPPMQTVDPNAMFAMPSFNVLAPGGENGMGISGAMSGFKMPSSVGSTALPGVPGAGGGGFGGALGSGLGGGIGGTAAAGAKLGFNVPTANLALSGLSTIAGLWGALQQNSLAKKSFAFNKQMAETNMANQVRSYNTALEDRSRSRAVMEGQTPAEAAAYVDRNRAITAPR